MLILANRSNKHIEGLRGLAILLVIIYHFFVRFQQLYLQKELNFFFCNELGSFGVSIFLVLTSYYMIDPGKLIHYEKNVLVFICKKLLRLWPTYVIAITITYVTVNIFYLPQRSCNALEYVANLFFINGFSGIAYVDGAHWYLTAIIGYIFMFAFLIRWKLYYKWYSFIIWLILNALLLLYDVPLLDKLSGGKYAGFAVVGYTISIAFKSEMFFKKGWKFYQWIIIGICSFIHIWSFLGVVYVIECIFAIILVYFCLQERLCCITWKPLVYFGTISYPLYLIHQNIGYVIEYYLMCYSEKYFISIAIFTMLVVLALGSLLYYGVERPIQNRIRHLKVIEKG